ncbi:MAG: hypothetical protein NXI12_07965 [Alphaproteobacteria bacterium]|nr:hypothetical protein [Alphaproteobacteria bacterium]
MTDQKDSAEFDRDEYNRAVKAARLLDVALTASEFSVKGEYFSPSETPRRLSSDYTLVDCSFDGSHLILLVRFAIEAKESNKKLLKCKCDYNVIYAFNEDDISEPAAKSFGNHIAQFTAYPYFRQHVSQLSWESGADLPILPVLKRMPMKKNE